MRKLVVNTYKQISKIDKNIYGNFSEHLGRCIYNGIYVGEDSSIPNVRGMRTDVVEALKKMRLPVLRWPGGCFADEYHWMDGIGPKENRKKMINTHWGGVVEDNSFGTHEFFEFCRQVGCEPYLCGNVGSGTVRELSEWIEYLNYDGQSPMAALRAENGHPEPFGLKYLAVGNENWGCGGSMTPEYYAGEYRRYQTYARNYPGARLFKVACGPNGEDYRWTEVLMQTARNQMDGLALHQYTTYDDGEGRRSTKFGVKSWYGILSRALGIEKTIQGHCLIMDRYDPGNKVALIVDEWGTWYSVEPGTNPGFLYQQNTVRDALVAGVSLNIFNQYSYRVKMANIAQLANVLQAVILTEGDKMLLTPTYHVFEMYKIHQNAMLLDSFLQKEEDGADGITVPDVQESVSLSADGTLNITLCNLSAERNVDMEAILTGFDAKAVEARILTGETDGHNTFEEPDRISARDYDGVRVVRGGLEINLPARSVLAVTARP